MDNTIETWAQGYFVDQPQYRNWSAEAKADANRREALLVRPGPTDNAICQAYSPDDAEWIAQRMNMAAKLEALANKLHTAEARKDQREWVACIDAIYRTAHLPPNDSDSRHGCPTENAVLRREWIRLQQMLKMAYCQKIGADSPIGLDCCDNYREWLVTLEP